VIKNLIELKNAQRLVIDGNSFEYSWAAAQSGHAFVLTPRNQYGGSPWSVVQHVQFTNNVVQHIADGFNILGTDYDFPSQTANDILVRNNLFTDVGRNWGGAGQLVLTQGGDNIVFDHNTLFTDGSSAVYADVAPVSRFVFTNNIIPDNAWAIMGANASEGNGTLAMYYPGARVQGNVIVGASAALYPAANYFPAALSAVGFVDVGSGNYRLASTSPYKGGASDGTDVGCNFDLLGQ
jgi:hypothetical protein